MFTVWLLIGQRTLHHETFVMPAPIENHAECYAHLLRRNHGLRGVAFTIGPEEAIYLEGRTPLEGLDADALDEVIGTHWEAVSGASAPRCGSATGRCSGAEHGLVNCLAALASFMYSASRRGRPWGRFGPGVATPANDPRPDRGRGPG